MEKLKKILKIIKFVLTTAAVFVLSFNLLNGSDLRIDRTQEHWAAAAITIIALFIYTEFRKK